MAAGPDERKDQQEAFELVRRGVHVGVVGVAVRALSSAVESREGGEGGEACGIRELEMMVTVVRKEEAACAARHVVQRGGRGSASGWRRSGVRRGEESGI